MPSHDRLAPYYDALHRDHDYDGDCDFVESIFSGLNISFPASILDIGCGTGQHSIRLSERGHRVVGLDVSEEMLKRARQKADGRGLNLAFRRQDMRRMELDDKFDCAICLFGAFARLHSDEDFSRFFRALNDALRTGGTFIFDFINADGAVGSHRSWKVVEDAGLRLIALDRSERHGCFIRDHHEVYVLDGGTLVDNFVEEHDLRSQTPEQIRDLLAERGYKFIHPPGFPSTTPTIGSRVAAIRTGDPRR